VGKKNGSYCDASDKKTGGGKERGATPVHLKNLGCRTGKKGTLTTSPDKLNRYMAEQEKKKKRGGGKGQQLTFSGINEA